METRNNQDRNLLQTIGRRLNLNSVPLNIRAKIILPFLFLALVLAIAAGFVITRIVFDTIEERFANQLVESGKLAAEQMVVEENQFLSTFRLLANTVGVSEAIQQRNPETLRELTFGTIVNHQEEAVEFIDKAGNIILSIHHREGGRIEEYEFSTNGENLDQWDFVQKVLAGQQDALGDKFSGFARATWGNYFYIAGPIFNQNGEFVGAGLVGISLEKLSRKLREETLAQVTIYELDGKVITSTLSQPQDLPLDESRKVLDSQDRASFRRELVRDVTVQNIDYGEILGPWEGRGDVDLGVLGVALGKSFLINSTISTRLQATLIVALALVLVVLIGLNLSFVITRPILHLVRASKQVSNGNLNVKLEPTSRDELSELTITFNQMVSNLYESKTDLIESYDSTLEGWSKALELRDKETEGHAVRVTDLTLRMARQLGIAEDQMEHVRRGALLHDIGKMGIPDSILLKPGKLSEDEIKIMRNHPIYAYDMLKSIDFLRPALPIPYSHHEHWDGNGYPQGLKGTQIPLEARIFALVDVWDAITSDRPYRKALSKNDAIDIIKQGIGNHFDPDVARIFLRMITNMQE